MSDRPDDTTAHDQIPLTMPPGADITGPAPAWWLEPGIQDEDPFAGTTRWYGDRAALFSALAKAQGEFPEIPRTRTVTVRMKEEKGGGTYTYSYAPLEVVIDRVRAALSANGLAYNDRILETKGGRVLVSYLMHSSGAYAEARIKLADFNNPQDFGKAVTYARRYQVQCMLGVAPEHDDDGGEEEVEDRASHRSAAPPAPRGDRHPNAPDDSRPMPPKPPNKPTGGTYDDLAQLALTDFRARLKDAGTSRALLTPLKEVMDEYKGHAVFEIASKEFIAAWKAAR